MLKYCPYSSGENPYCSLFKYDNKLTASSGYTECYSTGSGGGMNLSTCDNYMQFSDDNNAYDCTFFTNTMHSYLL